ncbi:MAG: Hpt domain-containing protein, partial [Haliea sp.]|nr:Hpt domain-containing protein [Haliea sp.]
RLPLTMQASLEEVADAPLEAEALAAAELSWCVPRDITFTFSTRGGSELFKDFLDAFIEEAGAELEKLEDGFGAWERDPGGVDAPKQVSRVLHTLKGIAKGVGLQRYGTLIHNFETLLDRLPCEPGGEALYFRIINAWLDATVRGYDHVQNTRNDVASELPLQQDAPPLPSAMARWQAAGPHWQHSCSHWPRGSARKTAKSPMPGHRRSAPNRLFASARMRWIICSIWVTTCRSWVYAPRRACCRTSAP